MAKRLKPKKQRRPRVVSILGVKVKVRYISKELHDDSDQLHGAFNADTMEIFISTKSDVSSVLLHEVCHALLYISGCSQRLSEKDEEAIVTAMEYGLRDYFRL